MQPRELQPGHFNGYPPQARSLVTAHLEVLKRLPLSFLPIFLREVIEYDYKFPAEREEIDSQLAFFDSLSPDQLKQHFQSFQNVSLSHKLEQFDWIGLPGQFVEQQSAYLWSTHQLDAFRKAATDYGAKLQSMKPAEPPALPRLGIAVIGQEVSSYDGALFRNMRPHGTYFRRVKPDNGVSLLLACIEARAKAHPVPYGHWYVDGGQALKTGAVVTSISYQQVEPLRAALLERMQAEIQQPGMGPEELRTRMARLTPLDLGMEKTGDAVLDRFQVKLLTEGSGTQIYSTTFAQWAAREILRRAQALTLMVRFAPRQRQRPMNELLSRIVKDSETDPAGSLIDADMSAYYHWINQQRLPGSERSSFLVWFEGHNQALAIAPSLPKGTESGSELDLGQLLSLITS